jgi:hypothetical protein
MRDHFLMLRSSCAIWLSKTVTLNYVTQSALIESHALALRNLYDIECHFQSCETLRRDPDARRLFSGAKESAQGGVSPRQELTEALRRFQQIHCR